ncbi:MAG: DUF1569 domain-containing protein [Pseudomonadota bacterium]
MDAQRRSAVRKVGVVIGVGALAAPVLVSAVRPAPLASARFASIDAALNTLAQLKTAAPRMTGAWDLAQVLHHTAQSVEFSMAGFPALKPAWFRATLGSYAFALFNARGAMSHDLTEPIPGAAPIAQGQPLLPAVDRAIAALRAFDAHTGALQPHFAYGTLDKPAYARAHLMHLANHWNEAGVTA